ncbi:MAG: M16 family metallopeptidase [Bacillota bacterium]
MDKYKIHAKEHLLSNGLKLVTIEKDTKIASIHIGVQIGSLFESDKEKGICHFIEHMLFKGTLKRDNHMINHDLEETAGSYNAYTEYTSTVFSMTALTEELEASVEIFSDMIMHSTFPEEEIEKEKGVIIAEIRSTVDDVEEYSFAKIHDLAFMKSPLKYDITGTEESVRRLTKQQLEEFYHRYYVPNNCVICIVSSNKHEEIRRIVEKYFAEWKNAPLTRKKIITEKNRSVEKISYKSNIEQNTLLYLYTFYGLSRRDELTLSILNHKLGASSNSTLFRALREERGIAYDVYSQVDTSEHVKTLYIYTAVGEDDIEDAKQIIEDSIKQMKKREIDLTEKHITLMKRVVRTAVALMLEDTSELCSYVLHQKMAERSIYEFQDDLVEIDKIEAEDIYKVANIVFNEPTVHILANKED